MPQTLAFPPDPILVGALDALDARVMTPVIQQEVLDDGVTPRRWHLEHCTIERINYKPHRSLRIAYRLLVRDADTGAPLSQLITARVYPKGRSSKAYRKANQRPLAKVEVGKPLSVVPELDTLLWGFPNDSKLSNLHHLCDEAWVRRHGLAAVNGLSRESRLRIEPVQYVPSHSFTVRVHLHSNEHRRTFYAKVYQDELGAATYEVMQRLCNSPPRRSGQLLLAEPVGFLSQEKMLWQEALPGRTFTDAEVWQRRFASNLRLAAQALANFHTADISACPLRTQQDWLCRTDGALEMLARVGAPVTSRCADVVGRLHERSPRGQEEAVATLHGDFHLGNMVLVGNQVGLIDLDEVRRGSPSQDLGSFAARLLKSALCNGRSTDEAFRSIAIFLKAYSQRTPWPLDRQAVDWYTAAYLIAYGVGRSFSTARIDADALASQIELADALIQDSGSI